MSAFSKAASVVEVEAENAIPALRGAKILVVSILTAVAIAAIVFAFWWIFIHPAQLKRAVAQGHVETTMAQAGTLNAGDALRVKGEVDRHKLTIDVITKGNEHAILTAPGGSAAADPGMAVALARAYCMRDAYRSYGGCAGVRPADPGIGPADGDPAGAAAAGDRGDHGPSDAH